MWAIVAVFQGLLLAYLLPLSIKSSFSHQGHPHPLSKVVQSDPMASRFNVDFAMPAPSLIPTSVALAPLNLSFIGFD